MSEEKKVSTTSLTEVLIGIDGKPLEMRMDENNSEEMTVRKAVLMCLLQGPDLLAQMNKAPMADGEKLKCFMLACDIGDKDRTGYTFSPEEVVLIKTLAVIRLPTEPYGMLLLKLDPSLVKDKD